MGGDALREGLLEGRGKRVWMRGVVVRVEVEVGLAALYMLLSFCSAYLTTYLLSTFFPLDGRAADGAIPSCAVLLDNPESQSQVERAVLLSQGAIRLLAVPCSLALISTITSCGV